MQVALDPSLQAGPKHKNQSMHMVSDAWPARATESQEQPRGDFKQIGVRIM